ncbi:Fic family protein [Leucothrix pacifica]
MRVLTLTHLWFVTIHPFDDGNGRIARALADHALAQDTRQPVLHSLSTAIEQNKQAYYDQLEQTPSGDE